MNVNVPAVAPTTPPDIGASTKLPRPFGSAEDTAAATSRDEVGSMVEQSIKSRGLGRDRISPFWRPSYVERIHSYVALTCFGSGRQVMMVSYESRSVEARRISSHLDV
jgi:hypothetical protein